MTIMLPTIMYVVSLLLALAATVVASPVGIIQRDAVAPPITSPTAKSVWTSGQTETVTWDTSVLEGVTPSNPNAQIILGTFVDGQEHLLLDTVLASNFSIFDGNVSFTMPSVATGSDYIVCLFGTSGNISPAFTINAASSSGITAIATSSNTLPPHDTSAGTSSTVSLPSGVTQTGEGSSTSTTPTSSAATSTATSPSSTTSSASITGSGVLPSGVSGTQGSTATSASTSSSTTASATAGASTSQGSSGARGLSVTGAHAWGAGAALAFWLLA